jgi:hypothetical protein
MKIKTSMVYKNWICIIPFLLLGMKVSAQESGVAAEWFHFTKQTMACLLNGAVQ